MISLLHFFYSAYELENLLFQQPPGAVEVVWVDWVGRVVSGVGCLAELSRTVDVVCANWSIREVGRDELLLHPSAWGVGSR